MPRRNYSERRPRPWYLKGDPAWVETSLRRVFDKRPDATGRDAGRRAVHHQRVEEQTP